MDIYIVLNGAHVVGVSAKLQGAELIRAEYAKRVSDVNWPDDPDEERRFYAGLSIVNADVKDMD